MKFAELWRRGQTSAWIVVTALVVSFAMGAQFTLNPTFSLSYPGAENFPKFVQDVSFAVATAVAIAFFVGESVERSYRNRIDELEKLSRERTISNVARTVFGSGFADELLDEALQSLFSSKIYRPSLHIEYTFNRHPRSNRIIFVDVITEYELATSGSASDVDVKLYLPNMMAHYGQDPLREKPTVLKVTVDKHEFTEAELSKLNDLVDINSDRPSLDLGKVTVRPDSTVKVRMQTRVIKLSSGSDTWRTLYPSANLVIEVNNLIGPHFNIDGSPVSRHDLPAKEFLNAEQTRWRWSIEGMLLPSNGHIIYWNDRSANPSDGSAVVKQGGEVITPP